MKCKPNKLLSHIGNSRLPHHSKMSRINAATDFHFSRCSPSWWRYCSHFTQIYSRQIYNRITLSNLHGQLRLLELKLTQCVRGNEPSTQNLQIGS